MMSGNPTSAALLQLHHRDPVPQRTAPGDCSELRARRCEHFAALLVLGTVWLVFAGPLLWAPGNLYLIDTMLIDLPDRLHAATMWRSGNFPFWTPLLECGFPLFYDGQTGILYPFFAMYLLAPTPDMHDAFMALHYAIAAVTMYGYLSGRGLRPVSAVVGAAAYSGGPPLAATHVVPGVIATMCWLPLALALIDRSATGKPRLLWWCAIVNALMLLAGFPNGALICFGVEFAYLVWTWRRCAFVALARACIIGLMVPIALAAVQLLPTLQYFFNSVRSSELEWAAVYHNRTESLRQILTLGVSDAGPIPIAMGGYLAAGVLVLASLLVVRKNDSVLFWLAVLVIGLTAAMATPMMWLFYYVPPFSWFRWPCFYLLASLMAYAVLVAIGFDGVLDYLGRSAATIARGVSIPLRQSAPGDSEPRRRFVYLSYLPCAAIALLVTNQSMRSYLSPPGWYRQASPAILRAAVEPGHFRLLPLMYGQVEGKEPETPQRYWPEARMKASAESLSPNYNLLHGVPVSVLKNQFDAVTPAEMTHLLSSERHISRGYLQVAAVTHIADIVPLESHLKKETEPIAKQPVLLYRVKHPLPRAWMVYHAVRVTDPHERVRRINAEDFDARRLAIVETDLHLGPDPANAPRVRWMDLAPARMRIEVETQSRGLLVIADMYATSLVATLDGRRVGVLKANHAFRGVEVGPGKHRVEIWFRPTAFYAGAAVSACALVLVSFQIARHRRR